MATLWYYGRAGKRLGPVSSAQLKDIAASGNLGPADLVWKDGMTDWVAANRIKGLFPEGAAADCPPPMPTYAVAQPAVAQAVVADHRPMVTTIKEGHFVFSCGYDQAWAVVEKAMAECDVKIKERSLEKGLLKGKCKYGINPFGITVTATFYSDGGTTNAEIAANLTDSFDTFGACKKKVTQLSERIAALAMAGQPAFSAPMPSSSTRVPPSYANREGPSYKGKAVTGFFLSLGGLFFGPCAIVGLIMCGKALTSMSTSSNKKGQGWAIAGLIVGFIALLGWIFILKNL